MSVLLLNEAFGPLRWPARTDGESNGSLRFRRQQVGESDGQHRHD